MNKKYDEISMEKEAYFRKYPVLLVAVSIIGIAVIVITIIGTWGMVKPVAFIGFFMNMLFYIKILVFALYGYHNQKSLTKKPVRNIMKSFCMLLMVLTLTTRPFNMSLALIYGIVITIVIVTMNNITDLKMCKVFVFVVLALLIVAAVLKIEMFGHMPFEISRGGIWGFNVMNQVIQWTALGMTYILRFTEYERAGYFD